LEGDAISYYLISASSAPLREEILKASLAEARRTQRKEILDAFGRSFFFATLPLCGNFSGSFSHESARKTGYCFGTRLEIVLEVFVCVFATLREIGSFS
jgi:hypothetical protein